MIELSHCRWLEDTLEMHGGWLSRGFVSVVTGLSEAVCKLKWVTMTTFDLTACRNPVGIGPRCDVGFPLVL